jgi:GxxExxY protein
MTENQITENIIRCAIKVHKTLGPGLLESAYEACLFYELGKAGLEVERQKAIPLIYEEVKLDCGYRADLLVEGKVIVELNPKISIAIRNPLICVIIYLIERNRIFIWQNFSIEKSGLKAVEKLHPISLMQGITHLRLTNCKVGLIINFNVIRLRDGIRRVVNNF